MRLLVRILAVQAVLALSGCSRPVSPPPPLPHIDFVGIPVCSLDGPLPRTEDVCVGWFTVERGLACVKCPAAKACIDTVDVVYCIGQFTNECSDGGRCTMGGSTGAVKR
jgi:hypothetical protein